MNLHPATACTTNRPLKKMAALLGLTAGLLLQSAGAWAVSLGNLQLKSSLNEPLKATLDLVDSGDLLPEQIAIGIGTLEDFQRAHIERDFAYTLLKFKVVSDSKDKMHVEITTEDAMKEPYMNFVVRLQWPNGKVTREYTLLLETPK